MDIRTRKQLDDLQAMREASRIPWVSRLNVVEYRPAERNPRNLWKRNCRAILGVITGRAK